MKKIMFLLSTILMLACSESELDDVSNSPPLNKPGSNTSTREVVLIQDEFEGNKIIIAGNALNQYIVSFYRTLNDELLEFTCSSKTLPVIMDDNKGNSWNIFGYAIDGPDKGQRLRPTQSLMGYWFSFAAFYPGLQVYPESGTLPNYGEKVIGTGDWLVPEDEVRSGGIGRDGIPSISEPKFDIATEVDYLNDDGLVVGISHNQTQVAYPHSVLDWHEIVNDGIGNLNYALIYCPLTGTATAWNRKIDGRITSFGVSGLLYNTNIVPYDRASKSNWSQLLDKAIWGAHKGDKARNYMVLETTFSTWKLLFPSSNVMNFATGHSRDYDAYPYGSYKTDDHLIFPVKYQDTRLHKKERVYAVIINGKARVYRFLNFTGN